MVDNKKEKRMDERRVWRMDKRRVEEWMRED